MGKSGLLSEKELRKLIEPKVKEIKKDIQKKSYQAIHDFYNDRFKPKQYIRSYGMYGILLNDIEEKKIKNGVELIFHYSVSDIEKQEHHGDVNWVFDADFIHGFHGGPIKYDGGYTWAFTPRLYPSPWDRIWNYVNDKY